jgi:lipid-A-disaccharide synthase
MSVNPFDIVIITNSAGELSALVKPLVEETQRSLPQARVIVVFTPCQYATGRELEEAKSLKGISEVIIPQEYKRWILQGKAPEGIKFNNEGIVVYMGGDLLHAVVVSKKLKFPAVAYTEKHMAWKNSFKLFMVPDEMTSNKFASNGMSKEKLKIVGNLMADSVPLDLDGAPLAKKLGINCDKPVVSFLPGSRPFQANHMVPFFLKVAEMMKKISPEIQFLFVLSPYLSDDEIKNSLKDEGVIYSQGDLKYIQSKSAAKVVLVRGSRHEAISLSNLVITIPGTNTAEISVIGKPMVVVFPMDKPEDIPMEGIADLLCRIPLLGGLVKRLTIKLVEVKTRFFALPNIKAGREIVPEFKGKVTAKEVAARAIQCLKDPEWLSETRELLKNAMGGRGAAKRISDEIRSIMEKA